GNRRRRAVRTRGAQRAARSRGPRDSAVDREAACGCRPSDCVTLIETLFDTPVGPMRALASDTALCALEFSIPKRLSRLSARLERWFEAARIEPGTNTVIERTRTWLDDYFAGRGADIGTLPLDPRGAP